jgi:pyruvate/2-oxoglutarate/acetoin dehydrogenase E1 component
LTYRDELRAAMRWLGEQPRSIFIGQSVAYPGTGMSETFADVPREKMLELPVFEDCQLGMSIGLSLAGELPVSVFPRWQFLLVAASQLVLHLDAIPRYSTYKPRVIVRTASATPMPLDAGPQHTGDYSDAFRLMLHAVEIVQLRYAHEIMPVYRTAAECEGSTIIVEYPELYDA